MLKSSYSKSIWLNVALLVPALTLLITVLSCNVTEDILPNTSFAGSLKNLPAGWEEVSINNAPESLKESFNSLQLRFNKELYIIKGPKEGFKLAEHLHTLRSEDLSGLSFTQIDGYNYQILLHNKWENNNLPIKAPAESDKEIYLRVENQPVPYGSLADFYHYVQSNLKYPAEAKKIGIEGMVYVQFIVASDGTLTDVKAVKVIGGGCDEEAVRVIANSPKWQPGTEKGKAVNVRMILPITFKLG